MLPYALYITEDKGVSQGKVRIIGGTWRGRKLTVPALLNLRPTPDRVRETLFNWLSQVIPGAHCLDAFAGSGVLGFEALSRGAAHVVLTDHAPLVVTLLQEQLALFKATNAEVYLANAPLQLKKTHLPFEIVFLDPPYAQDLLLPCCFYLEEQHFLAAECYIYLETRTPLEEKMLPANWRILKSKRTGQVAYHLALRRS